MAQVNITRQQFIGELIEDIKGELKKGEMKLTDDHIEKIIEFIRPTLEGMH